MTQTFDREFNRIGKLIETNSRFVLLSHIYTDGDALGPLIALNHYLKHKGKEVSVYVPSEVPEKYRFLNTKEIVNQGSRAEQASEIAHAEVIFILDISALKRLDIYFDEVKNSAAVKIVIDHHPVDTDWTDIAVVNEHKIATAELIYELLHYLNAEITYSIALPLYTAILSDSGSFRFFKTGASTFRMAAELVDAGVEPAKIYSYVFETAHTNQLRSWGTLLTHIQRDEKRSWLLVRQDFMQSRGLGLHEVEGLIDIIRRDGEANVVIVFVEKDVNEILVGLRSKDSFNVGKIARYFGGGGHFHAAGFTSSYTLNDTVEMTLERIKTDMQEIK